MSNAERLAVQLANEEDLDAAILALERIVDEGSEYEIETDIVIKSLGFDPEDLPKLFDEKDLQVSKWGTIKIDFDTMETNLKGVFAAGDIVRGASLVVWAIKDGRDVAESIDKLLKSKREQDLKVA